MTVFQAKDGVRFICLATPMYLHDRAGNLASLLYKAEMTSVCLSVRPVDISAVSAWIDVGLALPDSYVLWHIQVCFKKFVSAISIYLLYKAEMTSVRLSVCLTVTSIAQWFLRGSTWDLVCVQLWSLACECMFK